MNWVLRIWPISVVSAAWHQYESCTPANVMPSLLQTMAVIFMCVESMECT